MSFAVSTSGSSIQTALGPQALLSMKNPFTKLDTTNKNSFQTISLLFNHDPTQPPNASPYYADSLLYQFAHGYQYIPATWFSWQNPAPSFPSPPGSGGSATTFYTFGNDEANAEVLPTTASQISLFATTQYNAGSGAFIATTAVLYTVIDTTNVSIYMRKDAVRQTSLGGSVVPLDVIGESVNMRLYVFTEPATTSTY